MLESQTVFADNQSEVVDRMPKCSLHEDLFWGGRGIQVLKWPLFYETCKSLLALALEKLVLTVYNIQTTVIQCLIMLRRTKIVCIVLALHILRHNANITILLKDVPAGLFHLHMWLTIPTVCPLFELSRKRRNTYSMNLSGSNTPRFFQCAV